VCVHKLNQMPGLRAFDTIQPAKESGLLNSSRDHSIQLGFYWGHSNWQLQNQ